MEGKSVSISVNWPRCACGKPVLPGHEECRVCGHHNDYEIVGYRSKFESTYFATLHGGLKGQGIISPDRKRIAPFGAAGVSQINYELLIKHGEAYYSWNNAADFEWSILDTDRSDTMEVDV